MSGLRVAFGPREILRGVDLELAPGESVHLRLVPPAPTGTARQILWIDLGNSTTSLAEIGSPALQLATGVP